MKSNARKYLDLFLTFMKIGSLTFGGGYAMLPIIQREIVEDKKWVSNEEVIEYYAIGQCTPGTIAVNTSTFVGYHIAGTAGGILATVGFIFPAFVIICLIAGLLQNFADLAVVKNAFAGIRVCACVLIINAVINMWKSSVSDFFQFVIFAGVFLITVIFGLSPIWLVLASAAAGIIGGFALRKADSPYAKIFAGEDPADAVEPEKIPRAEDTGGNRTDTAGNGKEDDEK